jgi:hypothetical protein
MNPGDPNPPVHQVSLAFRALLNHAAYDLVPWSHRQPWWWCPSFDFVYFRVAYATGVNLDQEV